MKFIVLIFILFTIITQNNLIAQDIPKSASVTQDGQKDPLVHIDQRILAIEKAAQARIQAILEKMNSLSDPSKKAELQKEIEKIKLNAEIDRLKIELEIAQENGDYDTAQRIQNELYHLENLDSIGFSSTEEEQRLFSD